MSQAPAMSLIDIGLVLATPFDIVRLFAIPVFLWAAWCDLQTRRVPNKAWVPLLILGVLFLPVEAWLAWGTLDWPYFFYSTVGSLCLVVPGVFLFWYLGGFGGADAKAIISLAVLFPTYPAYYIAGSQYPAATMPIDTVAFGALSNATVGLVVVPVALVVWNLATGHLSKVAFLGKPESVTEIHQYPGKLLETPAGFSTSGLDLDVLRMYLRWRGITIADVIDHPDQIRRPGAVPVDPNDPTNGAVRSDDRQRATKRVMHSSYHPATPDYTLVSEPSQTADDWGAERFFSDVEKNTYGATTEDLQDGLELLSHRETVWVSPGLPFMIPLAIGLILTLTYGNILFQLIQFF